MQKRFCACGYSVLVQYGLGATEETVRTTFWNGAAWSSVIVCPCCGRQLDIDRLR